LNIRTSLVPRTSAYFSLYRERHFNDVYSAADGKQVTVLIDCLPGDINAAFAGRFWCVWNITVMYPVLTWKVKCSSSRQASIS